MGFAAAYNGNIPNSRGVKPGDWFLCTFDTKNPCVSDPAVWDVQGQPTLMTSITAPILANGQFIGLAGADLSVSFIQQLTKDINSKVYKGTGHMRVISYFGSVVADTREASLVGKPINDDTWSNIADAVTTGKEVVSIGTNTIEIILPLNFNHLSRPVAVTHRNSHERSQ